MDEKIVEILNGIPGKKGAYLNQVYDPKIHKYFVPIFPDDPFFENIRKIHRNGYNGSNIKVAVVDTGLMLDHPWINRSIEKSIDFTGEGVEDLNGHGTMVALILLATAPGVKIFNVKVMDSEGRGTEKDLIKGIEWAVQEGAQIINLSVGVYRKKWGIWDCKGDCKICRVAEKAARSGVLVVAAAGNEPGKTYCPAKVGIIKRDIGVISVAAYDFENKMIAPYSGVGNITAPVGKYSLVPVE